MKKYAFQPGPRCGNCKVLDRNRDKEGQPTNRYHVGSFCRKDEDPKACGGFVSRHSGGKKKRNFKPWQRQATV